MTLSAPFADLENMLTETTMGMLSNVIATPAAGGAAFRAMFSVNNTEFFERTAGADYTLRYAAASATLKRGDDLTLSANPLVPAGAVLRVISAPRPLFSGHECIAELARVGGG